MRPLRSCPVALNGQQHCRAGLKYQMRITSCGPSDSSLRTATTSFSSQRRSRLPFRRSNTGALLEMNTLDASHALTLKGQRQGTLTVICTSLGA